MWIWRISTFTPDLAVTWEFCPVTFLFVHQSACFMNVLQWTVFVSLLEKKNCPRISKSEQTPSPAESVCNQSAMGLTSMYTKVLKSGRNQIALPNDGKGSCHSILFFLLWCLFSLFIIQWNLCQCFLLWSNRAVLCPQPGFTELCLSVWMWRRVSEFITLLMQTLHQSQSSKAHHRHAAGSRTRLDLGLEDVWAEDNNVKVLSRISGPAAFVKTLHLSPLLMFLVLKSYILHDHCITTPVKNHCEWVHH